MSSNVQILFGKPSVFRRKSAIADAFSRAAHQYDQHAAFQRDVGFQLLAGLPDDLTGSVVLDLGCGTGFFSDRLRQRGAEVLCLDLSNAMLRVARQRCGEGHMHYALCDAEQLSLPDQSVDFVFSNLALQWCDSLAVPLREIRRVLKKGGRGYFSTLLSGSLSELEQAWRTVDSGQHVNRFITLNSVKIALAQADCIRYQIDSHSIRLWYDSALRLMKDLKGIGATHVDDRSKGMMHRDILVQLESAYQRFANREGLLPATYHVCFGVIHQ